MADVVLASGRFGATRGLRPAWACLLAVLLCAGCSTQKSREAFLGSVEEDKRIGNEAAPLIEAQMGVVTDAKLTAYVTAIGQRLVAHLPHRRFDYTFKIIDQDAPNAFAVPGGRIYISRGLLAMAMSEDELANVIGHEIVHVAHRHGRQQQSAGALPGLLALPGHVVGAAGFRGIGGLMASPFEAAGAIYLASHSRDHERESDELGQQLAAAAGYDPAAAADFFAKMQRYEALAIKGASRIPGFLRTHPSTPERITDTTRRAAAIQWTRSASIAGDKDAFIKQFSGLMIGSNPAEGEFRESIFMHPTLGFAIEMPAGWKLFNTSQAVGAAAGDREGMLVLQSPGVGTDPKQAGEAFFKDLSTKARVQITAAKSARINGLDAYVASALVGNARQRIGMETAWITHRGRIFRMIGMASNAQHMPQLEKTLKSYRALTTAERRSFRVKRLRLTTAKDGESLAELVKRTGSKWNAATIALMNGMKESDRLKAGQVIKVAVAEAF